MAVTGENVFLKAIKLIDEMDRNGQINDSKIVLYRTVAPVILTALQGELLPNSTAAIDYTDLSANLTITDKQALYVLPYGLAAEMMISQDDDQNISAYFSARYNELKKLFPAPATMGLITDIYNVTLDPSGGADTI